MSNINITNIQLLNNPSPFLTPLTFQITFECLKDLPEEVEWKLIYIGSSKEEKYDQVLDSFTMGPLQYGVMEFELESNPPDHNKIPQQELLGVTAIILSVSYKEQEFFRVGYYVYNTYVEQELIDNPPEQLQIDKIVRNILADKPRITRFDIKWGDEKDEENLVSTDAHSPANENDNPNQLFFNESPMKFSENPKENPFFVSNGENISMYAKNYHENLFSGSDGFNNQNKIQIEDPKGLF